MSTLKVNTILPKSGTSVTLGESGKTITIPSGTTIANSGTATGFGGDNTPYFSAQRSSGQSIGDNVETKIIFDSEIVDSDGCYDHSSTGRFTPTTAGKYLINATCGLTADAQDAFINGFLIVKKNGTQIAAQYQSDSTQTGRERPFSVTVIADMNGSSDYVEVFGKVDRTGSGNAQALGSNRSTFSGLKLID